MAQIEEKIPVIYILSNGHSGTTLLDLLLGAHPNIWTLGEAHILPWELRKPRVPCGCGTPLDEDDFWGDLIPELPLETDGFHIGYFRNEQQVGKVLRWKLLPDMLRGTVSARWEQAADQYANNNRRFFQLVRQKAQKRTGNHIHWLVDNSKDPYRLFWLKQSDYFDIRVVHLVKDPRAFVYSMLKITDTWTTGKVVRFAVRWIIENAIMVRLLKATFASDAIRYQTYENLAQNPKTTLASVGNWIGEDYPNKLVENFRNYENHAISGNIMRWRESDSKIRLDESWKQNLSPHYSRLIKAMTKPFASYCGHPTFDNDS